VLAQLQANDEFFTYRQIGVIDRTGQAAAYTGPARAAGRATCRATTTSPPATAWSASTWSRRSPRASSPSRRRPRAPPADGHRVGRDAGGQGTREVHKAERSSALLVYSRNAYPDIDLRVDLHETAVEELRRVWIEYKKYEAYYRHRGEHPRGAPSQEAFMASLQAADA
jgi:uncharacterized Ntn-hydrolase superfamily protein